MNGLVKVRRWALRQVIEVLRVTALGMMDCNAREFSIETDKEVSLTLVERVVRRLKKFSDGPTHALTSTGK